MDTVQQNMPALSHPFEVHLLLISKLMPVFYFMHNNEVWLRKAELMNCKLTGPGAFIFAVVTRQLK